MIAEPIDFALQTAGTLLEFEAGFEIYGILGFNLTKLISGQATPYEAERQNFSFQIATKDSVNNLIEEEMPFSFTDDLVSLKKYYFLVSKPVIDDLTGWGELHAYLTRAEPA